MFTIRWILPADLQRQYYPAIADIGPTLPARTSIFYAVIFYLVWQILYYIFIVYGRREKVQSGSRVTSYTWLLTDKKGFVSHLIEKFGLGGPNEGISIPKILFYFFLQFAYMVLSILPVSLLYYRYMLVSYLISIIKKTSCFYFRYVNLVFLCLIFAVSVYNGASFYIGKTNHCTYLHL